ncbi:KIN17-like protein [Grifola frondosa]|uniref:KIN17-like protein n=1 Tax=Grifola frondosa TaxID=5627 RepID=A0A1C7LWP3_GRIFR|nr:KIN17-like protein [Grifola frondosa]
MPRAEVGTPKYLANKMKAKGLQRLRWYCQVCQKQCRDENGFKCHAQSESTSARCLYSSTTSSSFSLADLHMNSTRWVTLTEFVKHLGRTGVARVDETEKGWFIAWIDSSPKALAKQEASMKKERATTSDEQRERTLINEQIERAAAEAEASGSSEPSPPADEGLKREEGVEKIVLSLTPKAPAIASPTSSGATTSLRLNSLKPAVKSFKAGSNPSNAPTSSRSLL